MKQRKHFPHSFLRLIFLLFSAVILNFRNRERLQQKLDVVDVEVSSKQFFRFNEKNRYRIVDSTFSVHYYAYLHN